MLKRIHRPGVDVQVGIELLESDAEAPVLQKSAERCPRETFAEGTDHAARHEDVFHGNGMIGRAGRKSSTGIPQGEDSSGTSLRLRRKPVISAGTTATHAIANPAEESTEDPGRDPERGGGTGGAGMTDVDGSFQGRASILLGPVPEFAGRSRGDARDGGLHGVCGVGCSEEKSQQGRVRRSARNTPCTRSSAAGMRSG